MEIGDKIPYSLGYDQNGDEVLSETLRGRKIILYFYPKDMTSGCTAQACNLRDAYADLTHEGYAVIGVSVDSAKRHKSFIEKNALPFNLIADEGHRLAELFGVWAEKKMCGRTYMGTLRTTFLFDEEGTLVRIIPSKEVKTSSHAQQILGRTE